MGQQRRTATSDFSSLRFLVRLSWFLLTGTEPQPDTHHDQDDRGRTGRLLSEHDEPTEILRCDHDFSDDIIDGNVCTISTLVGVTFGCDGSIGLD